MLPGPSLKYVKPLFVSLEWTFFFAITGIYLGCVVDMSKETGGRAGEKDFVLSVLTVKCPPKLTPLSTLCNQTQRPCDLMTHLARLRFIHLLMQ